MVQQAKFAGKRLPEMTWQDIKFDESKNPNVSHDPYQLRELRTLLLYLLATVAVVVALVETSIWALPYALSLQRERQWFDFVGQYIIADEQTQPDARLQNLANQLGVHLGLPENTVDVYISEKNIPNAYATFGGNVVLYRGLLNRLPSEESVAAVLAHEMAHIRHRDPLRGMSRSVFYNAIAAMFGSDAKMHQLAALEGLRYSRDLEYAADEAAAHAILQQYGDVQGARQLFNALQEIEQEHGLDNQVMWLRTHPHTADRLQRLMPVTTTAHPTRPNPWRKNL